MAKKTIENIMGGQPAENRDVSVPAESPHEQIIETERETAEAAKPEKPEKTEQELRQEIDTVLGEKKAATVAREEQPAPMGDFLGSPLTEAGQIKLSQEQSEDAARQIENHKRKFSFSAPSLAKGYKTATEYDSKVSNFSTRTKILNLETGEKVFAVYNYPLSFVHRLLDGASKRLAGDRMSKASSKDWKKTFESRSNIPTIECDDPDMVLLPYIPNVNAHDLFAKNHEIKDFGECSWAENITLDDKLEFGDKMVHAIEAVHNKGKRWGETILPNIIITAEKQVVIVDPETQYDKGVPLKEQKARDLRDMIMSICGALRSSEGESAVDYGVVTQRLMSQYSDKSVIEELKTLVAKKPTFIQKMFRGAYESARLGISAKEYEKVAAAISADKDKVD